jgi:hypothetical protein
MISVAAVCDRRTLSFGPCPVQLGNATVIDRRYNLDSLSA